VNSQQLAYVYYDDPQRLSRSAATKRGGSHAKLPELVRKSDYSPAR
jgi:hypothetical protein